MEEKLIVLSGPSGVGKGTICNLLDPDHLNLRKSVSLTTRDIRDNDIPGVTYNFVTREEFEETIKKDGFLEHACYSGNYYGTPKAPVEKWFSEGRNVILEIETNGAAQIMKDHPDAISIFILPKNMEVLKERLVNRGTDTPEQIEKRLAAAKEEIKRAGEYQYQVVNDVLEDAVKEVTGIIEKELGLSACS